LIKYSFDLKDPKMLGHMFTTWSRLHPDSIATYKPLVHGAQLIQKY
jgi:hypothetical protein